MATLFRMGAEFYVEGDVLSYSCPDDMQLVGPDTNICGGGAWTLPTTGDLPSCESRKFILYIFLLNLKFLRDKIFNNREMVVDVK